MIYGTNSRKKEFDGKCIVAFIDILGFSNEIKSTWNNSAEELFKIFLLNVEKNEYTLTTNKESPF